jgi:hypothetical protein
MAHTFLKNLLRALISLSAAFILTSAANGQGVRDQPPQATDGDASTAANSIMVRTSLGVAMELSAPLEVSCERMSVLEKTGQGKPAEVTSGTSGDGGTARSGRTTPGKADQAEASQITVPSHGRILTLKIAEGTLTVSCDAASDQGAMPAQPSGTPPPQSPQR